MKTQIWFYKNLVCSRIDNENTNLVYLVSHKSVCMFKIDNESGFTRICEMFKDWQWSKLQRWQTRMITLLLLVIINQWNDQQTKKTGEGRTMWQLGLEAPEDIGYFRYLRYLKYLRYLRYFRYLRYPYPPNYPSYEDATGEKDDELDDTDDGGRKEYHKCASGHNLNTLRDKVNDHHNASHQDDQWPW